MDNDWIRKLVSETLKLPSKDGLTNFYHEGSDTRSEYQTSAADRLSVLQAHLASVVAGELILVGEAAGWRGARQSGVAFTAAPMVGLPGTREASATVVQQSLLAAGVASETLLWNALPTHPYRAGAPQTNRTPTASEVREATDVLRLAIGQRLALCVGNTAAKAVSVALGEPIMGIGSASPSSRAVQVRHPSFGGAPQFRKDLAAALSLWGR